MITQQLTQWCPGFDGPAEYLGTELARAAFVSALQLSFKIHQPPCLNCQPGQSALLANAYTLYISIGTGYIDRRINHIYRMFKICATVISSVLLLTRIDAFITHRALSLSYPSISNPRMED